MNSSVWFLLIFCLLAITIGGIYSEEQHKESDGNAVEAVEKILKNEQDSESGDESSTKLQDIERENAGRSIAEHHGQQDVATKDKDHHAEFKKRAKPFKNIFLGIYKNYKSTYMGNRTLLDYKKTLRERVAAANQASHVESEEENVAANDDGIEVTTVAEESDAEELKDPKITSDEISQNDGAEDGEVEIAEHANVRVAAEENNTASTATDDDTSSEPSTLAEFVMETYLDNINKKRRKRKRNQNRKATKNSKTRKPAKIAPPAGGDDPLVYAADNEYRYSIGQGMNMSLDLNDHIVSVSLEADSLRELITGRWLSDNSAQGRSRKYDMVSKFLPLFILPFLIQSAIVPFLVTKLKLLLVKSILVGKLAIFLLILSAIKNGNKSMQSYEVAPSYWAGEPSRRSELAAIASSGAYNGYRVEGKPTAWIN